MMCLIIDANAVVSVLSFESAGDFGPVAVALRRRKAVAVYGGKLAQEYRELKTYMRIVLEMDRQGMLRRFPDGQVDAETKVVKGEGKCVSNDHHVIALARVANVRLLCSLDKNLHADFTNPDILSPRGSVYQRPGHKHLIRKHCKGISSQ